MICRPSDLVQGLFFTVCQGLSACQNVNECRMTRINMVDYGSTSLPEYYYRNSQKRNNFAVILHQRLLVGLKLMSILAISTGTCT